MSHGPVRLALFSVWQRVGAIVENQLLGRHRQSNVTTVAIGARMWEVEGLPFLGI